MESLVQQLEILKEKIQNISKNFGFQRKVKLIGASKNVSPERLGKAYEAGLKCFGENRAQELKTKVGELPEDCEWHFIGALQSNKVKDVVPLVSLIHSVDKKELAEEINRRAGLLGKTQKVLVEVNVGDEASKHGCKSEDAASLVKFINECQNLEVIGLMTVAPFFETLKQAVEINAGVAIVPESAIEKEIKTGTLVALQLAGAPQYRTLGIIYKAGRMHSPAIKRFLQTLKESKEPALESQPI